jgi:beta-galactosidase
MYIGVDYYPEHWPKERWETDIKLMKKAGFNVVRLAEFSWINMEPVEGKFEFDWLDEVLKLLDKYDMFAILGTPTAVMPAWLAKKYPEALAMKRDGTRIVWGGRKNNCFTNDNYFQLSIEITRRMAEHFVNAPNVIGWQIDNEFGGTDCQCSTCRAGFQDWLRNKYRTLEELNRRWGTHFWGLTFHNWDEIPIPDDCSGQWAISNPSACLDWKRYTSWLNVRFQAEQVKIIRKYCPDDFITHNFMGLYSGMDYYELAKDLDFVSWDSYPIWSEKPDIPYSTSFAAALMRGLKQKNFMMMEQTAGPCGWGSFGRNPRPGEIRKIVYQHLAHGADGQIWFRWRTCTTGREQYWHGLLGHDGKPLRRYQEAAKTTKELRKLEPYLEGTTIKSKVAIIYDYDCIWSLDFQPGYSGNSFQGALLRYYKSLFRAGVNVDIVHPDADISEYNLVLAPHLTILPDRIARKLNEYVREGGILLTDCRTAVKDETNICHERTLPGLLSPMLGIRIEEYSSLGEGIQYRVSGIDEFPGDFTTVRYVDWITAEDADVLADYSDQWHLKSFAAITKHNYGHGQGWYVGTVIQEDSFYDQLIAKLLESAGITPVVNPPLGVEVSIRHRQDCTLIFLINHTEDPQFVEVPKGKQELLGNTKTNKTIKLEAFDVAVIKL